MEDPTWLVLYVNSYIFILAGCFPFFIRLPKTNAHTDGLNLQHSA